jgi:hypothetical protein
MDLAPEASIPNNEIHSVVTTCQATHDIINDQLRDGLADLKFAQQPQHGVAGPYDSMGLEPSVSGKLPVKVVPQSPKISRYLNWGRRQCIRNHIGASRFRLATRIESEVGIRGQTSEYHKWYPYLDTTQSLFRERLGSSAYQPEGQTVDYVKKSGLPKQPTGRGISRGRRFCYFRAKFPGLIMPQNTKHVAESVL